MSVLVFDFEASPDAMKSHNYTLNLFFASSLHVAYGLTTCYSHQPQSWHARKFSPAEFTNVECTSCVSKINEDVKSTVNVPLLHNSHHLKIDCFNCLDVNYMK